ncbi:V-type proton ATPase 116 kDa subunit a 1 [Octopus bimaculoides]|uniref:V-type proton ATPase subunit a n=1 Tax=Octopus bimaculoides TaxID=37653 RepID=A0A0L8H512_OCTBM|nr:V-type proton ATPase 116 kDa subunit a 1 [Octopus bimaculoides]XP_052828654.1 V-type proton ATPase 116 kDa subunit a 1 [Octopus bimaculoides]|eukprot:XP_014775364.1 PREDICTED: V-type proton ATPase 116 kDa subunit a isoform 1-like [Octopus bimaculoides]
MSIFRSEEMTLCQLFLQSEAAYPVVSELGELGMVQFRDLNPDVNAFQRKFVSEVRRCEEMERKMRYIEKEMTIDGIKMDVSGVTPKAPPPKEMVDLEASLEKMESELREVKVNEVALKKNYLDLAELKEVLTKVQGFFAAHAQEPQTYMEDHYSVIPDNSAMTSGTSAVQLGFITGVIKREKVPAFERLMWFACRGNVFPRFDEIKDPLIDPVTGDEIRKNVFIVFYQGEQLKNRVRKICEGFHANVYPCPDTAQDRQETLTGVTNRLLDLNIVLAQTKEHRIRVLTNAKKELYVWRTKVEKIKAIYHTLNMFNFDVSHNSLIAEGWTPVIALEKVQAALEHGKEVSSSHAPNILHRMQTIENPPTYIQNNKFTSGFQAIVDAYGIADYGEVNPALYTVITFPFLFGVMFGDTGHGFLLFLFGLTLVLLENKLSGKGDNEIFNTFFGGRYIIMLMGLFAMYTGLIYNDCYSKSFNIFGTSWHSSYSNSTMAQNTLLQFDPNNTFATGEPYPFGLDPIWQMTKNKLSFTNSYKMKMSVVIAVIHMLFGVFLSLINNLYFARPLNIFCEFIPQVIFLLSIFGYLDILIFYKWIAFSVQNLAQAQSLLLQLISMFLFESKSNELYKHQTNIQTILVVLAFICVPWMLLIKPFIIWFKHQSAMKRRQLPTASSQRGLVNCDDDAAGNYVINVDEQVEVSSESVHSQSELPEFNFGDIFVHQCIHTIEYCLGCISNTASYLRLWALSLAHAELSEVLWNMVMRIGLSMNVGYLGCIIIFAVFFFWAILTIAILLIMEGLSAFLHALRLHWVEFQNKFYAGNGYNFQPFDFQHCINLPFED